MANDVQDGKALPNFDYSMMDACKAGDLEMAKAVFNKAKIKNGDNLSVSQQESEHGLSPLMVAAQNGHLDICKFLITEGAPWNACSKVGKCAGNYATENEHWEVVNFLVDAGTKAELILSASIRLSMMAESSGANAGTVLPNSSDENKLVEHEPCTKPDYLERNVRYNDDNTLLLDDDDDAVMMEWERPLMDAHASVITSGAKNRRILNVGFGLGIIDKAIQKYDPALHVIMEAHPLVYKKMIQDGWDKKSNVRICFGKWQDELPKLIEEGIIFDGIFYDTYGEHFTDLEDFHNSLPRLLSKPDGIYSFFNGLAPDNLFFHGVACQCVKVQLGHLHLDSEFASCEIQVDENDWEGVRRKYWFGRDTYYLPIITWNKDHVANQQVGESKNDKEEGGVSVSDEVGGKKKRKIDETDE